MCNDYEEYIAYQAYKAAMARAGMPVGFKSSAADLPAKDHIRIRDRAPIIVAAGNSADIVPMRWSFPPARSGGKPVFNFRSDGRSFSSSNRCLIPASAFFEFTGAKYPKTRHRFTLAGETMMCIAGIWRSGEGGVPNFTMLTTAPGPDIAPYHNRQIVVLKPDDWAHWVYLTKSEAELLKPLPAGSLEVTS